MPPKIPYRAATGSRDHALEEILMPGLEMNPTDLGELYILLRVYVQCYSTEERDSQLLAEVEEKYRVRYRSYNHRDAPAEIRNPRNAGRKPTMDPAQAERIRQMHADGKTIREIAAAESCSTGYVHKLIREHADSYSVL